MPFEITQPRLLLALLVLPILAWYFYRGLTDFSRWQRLASLAVRAVVVCLLVAALSGLTWLKPAHELFVVFAIDDSLSVSEEAKPQIDSFLARAAAGAQNNRFACVRFGVEPGPLTRDWTTPFTQERRGTNIASALEVAAARHSPLLRPPDRPA